MHLVQIKNSGSMPETRRSPRGRRRRCILVQFNTRICSRKKGTRGCSAAAPSWRLSNREAGVNVQRAESRQSAGPLSVTTSLDLFINMIFLP